MSFAELHEKAEAVALFLADRGVGAGKKVFTFLPKDLDWITSLALMRLGAISASLTRTELKPNIFSQFDIGVLGGTLDVLAAEGAPRIITFGPEAFVTDLEVEMVSDPYVFEDTQDFRVVLADAPEGAPGLGFLSLASVGRRVEAMAEIQHGTGFELNLSDLGSWFGLVSAIRQLDQGRPLVTLGKLDARSVSRFAPLPIETISGSPIELSTAAVALSELEVSFKGLQTLVMAGAALSENFYPHIRDNLDVEIVNVLGDPIMGFTFINRPQANHQIQDLGKLFDGVKAKVTDDLGRPSLPGDIGYLSLKSPFMCLDASSPQNSFVADAEYVDTGKKAVFQAGHYRLADEEPSWSDIRSDLILTQEIEALVSSLPGVSEVALVRAFGPLGEPIVALAVNADEGTTLEYIFNEVRDSIPDSIVSHVVRVRFIARDSNGVPLKQELAKFVTSELADEASQ